MFVVLSQDKPPSYKKASAAVQLHRIAEQQGPAAQPLVFDEEKQHVPQGHDADVPELQGNFDDIAAAAPPAAFEPPAYAAAAVPYDIFGEEYRLRKAADDAADDANVAAACDELKRLRKVDAAAAAAVALKKPSVENLHNSAAATDDVAAASKAFANAVAEEQRLRKAADIAVAGADTAEKIADDERTRLRKVAKANQGRSKGLGDGVDFEFGGGSRYSHTYFHHCY